MRLLIWHPIYILGTHKENQVSLKLTACTSLYWPIDTGNKQRLSYTGSFYTHTFVRHASFISKMNTLLSCVARHTSVWHDNYYWHYIIYWNWPTRLGEKSNVILQLCVLIASGVTLSSIIAGLHWTYKRDDSGTPCGSRHDDPAYWTTHLCRMVGRSVFGLPFYTRHSKRQSRLLAIPIRSPVLTATQGLYGVENVGPRMRRKMNAGNWFRWQKRNATIVAARFCTILGTKCILGAQNGLYRNLECGILKSLCAVVEL